MMTKFMLVLTPDLEDGGYTVEAIGLPGLVTNGPTVEEALHRAKEAIELYFEGEDGVRLAAGGVRLDDLLTSVDVDVRIPDNLLARAAALA
jgi:predicted RNase H-like HicB family nuclease